MSPEQFAAILFGIAAILGGIARTIAELRAYHRAVNSKMDELLAITESSAFARGRLRRARSNVGKFPTAQSGEVPIDTRLEP